MVEKKERFEQMLDNQFFGFGALNSTVVDQWCFHPFLFLRIECIAVDHHLLAEAANRLMLAFGFSVRFIGRIKGKCSSEEHVERI